ncbi:MAG: hypothetical protein V5A57_02365 [Candidatus Paceibacterota bacterium]
MEKLTSDIKELRERYQNRYRSFRPNRDETIHIDQKVTGESNSQGLIDWEQKQSLRRSAIRKILRKKLITKKENEIAEYLVKELIRNGHLPNDEIPECKISKTQNLIDKFVFILGHASEKKKNKTKKQLQNWLLDIIVCEIEDTLTPKKEELVAEYMSKIMFQRITSDKLEKEEKKIQTYIASHKALLNPDKSLLTYYLLLKKLPYWQDPDQEQLINITVDIYSIWEDLREDLNHSLQKEIYKTCKKFTPIFQTLEGIIEKKNSEDLLKKPEQLEEKIKEVFRERVNRIKQEVFKTIVVSVLGITFLKTVIFLTVENPFTNFPSNWLAIAINLFAPAALLLFSFLVIEPPRDQTFHLLTLEIMKLFYGKKKEHYSIQLNSPLKKALVSFYHLSTFFIFSGLIVLGLYKLSFPLLSLGIFLIIIYLVSFVIYQVQQKIQKEKLSFRSSNLLQKITESFAAPLVETQKIIKPFRFFLSRKL